MFLIFLLNLFIFSFTLNLKKQNDDINLEYIKQLSHLTKRNNSIYNSKNNDNNYHRIDFEMKKHHIKEEHLDLDAFLFNNSKFEDFTRNLEIHKAIEFIDYNSTSYHDNLFKNISEESKADQDLLYDILHEADKNNITDDIRNKENSPNLNKTEEKHENDNTVQYDFVYYPKASGSKINFPMRKDGVFGCRNCNNDEDSENALNMKVPYEDKWVKLEPVKFVKQISATSKEALEIENIEE